MKFSQDYYHTMDRGYSALQPLSYSPNPPIYGSSSGGGYQGRQPSNVNVEDIGKTITEGRGQGSFLNTLRAAIWEGAGKIELSTVQEGSDRAVGAEAYGKDKRLAIKQLADINKVQIVSVHAPHQVGNISGFDGQGQFSEHNRTQQVEEIKKAIDFASDVTHGGSIVVHTGEFPRSIVENWGRDDQTYKFRSHPNEIKESIFYLADERTGKIENAVKKDQKVIVPQWKVDKDGDYVDEFGGKTFEYSKRAPELDSNGVPIMLEVGWEHFVKEAERYKKNNPGAKFTPQEAFFHATMDAKEEQARAWANNWAKDYENIVKKVKQLKEAKEAYEKIEKTMDPSNRWKLEREWRESNAVAAIGLGPADKKLPTEILDEQLRQYEKSLQQVKEGSISYLQQAEEIRRMKGRLKPIEQVGFNRSVQSIAELGMFAMEKTQAKHLEKPLFIAPEHIFPEMGYGSHPEELITMVKSARERMVELLTQKEVTQHFKNPDGQIIQVANPKFVPGLSRSEAEKFAKDSIKATFDTQHLGMWRKHFVLKDGETDEQADKRFNKWYMDQVKRMEEEGIIGNIHIVDGWGRGHTHLAAGQGKMPVRDAVEYLKSKGYTGNMNSEAYEDDQQLFATWRGFGSNVYDIAGQGTLSGLPNNNWSEVQNQYFGKNQPPYFVFGEYSPNAEEWGPWSGTRME